VLFVAEVVLWIVLGIFIHVIPFLACAAVMFFPLLGLAIFIFHIYLILQAQKGQRVMVPGLSDFANRF
jgi:uncharacterized membrane protein